MSVLLGYAIHRQASLKEWGMIALAAAILPMSSQPFLHQLGLRHPTTWVVSQVIHFLSPVAFDVAEFFRLARLGSRLPLILAFRPSRQFYILDESHRIRVRHTILGRTVLTAGCRPFVWMLAGASPPKFYIIPCNLLLTRRICFLLNISILTLERHQTVFNFLLSWKEGKQIEKQFINKIPGAAFSPRSTTCTTKKFLRGIRI